MIRAGVSGTNWTGKTLLIHTFVERQAAPKIETVPLSDLVRICPHPTVEDQIPETSRWMVEQVARILQRPADAAIQLFDRSPVDILAFTYYAFDREETRSDPELVAAICELLDLFDAVFYLPLSDEWPMGISPKPNEIAFALLMDRYIRQSIKRHNVAVVNLPWDASERQRLLAERLCP